MTVSNYTKVNLTGDASLTWGGRTAGMEIQCSFLHEVMDTPCIREALQNHAPDAEDPDAELSNVAMVASLASPVPAVPEVDTLFLQVNAPYRLTQGVVTYAKERVATVQCLPSPDGHHGVVITMAKNNRASSAALKHILNGVWYRSEDTANEGRTLGVSLRVTIPVSAEGRQADVRLSNYYALRVLPGDPERQDGQLSRGSSLASDGFETAERGHTGGRRSKAGSLRGPMYPDADEQRIVLPSPRRQTSTAVAEPVSYEFPEEPQARQGQ